jgi:hypothetical protein
MTLWRWEVTVFVVGVLPGFETVLDDHSSMTLFLHVRQGRWGWSAEGDGSGHHCRVGRFCMHLFLECLAQSYKLVTLDEGVG